LDLGLTNKTALILGGSGGLGSAIARRLAAEGARVAVAGRDRDKVEAITSSIRSNGGKAIPLVWDLADLDAIAERVAEVESEFSGIDILINNTGGPPPSPVAGQPQEHWLKQFESMVLSVIALTDTIVPGMRERRWGRIITSASSGIIAPIPNLGLSNALRSTLVGWSKTLASEIARDGITVNLVVPGRIATQRIVFLDEQRAKRSGRPVNEVSAESIATIPVGRYGNPEEYADVVAFLASRNASFVNGAMIRVDGGMIPSI
jgi:3-oxoacyl-[acyl-carrier protein] reductase